MGSFELTVWAAICWLGGDEACRSEYGIAGLPLGIACPDGAGEARVGITGIGPFVAIGSLVSKKIVIGVSQRRHSARLKLRPSRQVEPICARLLARLNVVVPAQMNDDWAPILSQAHAVNDRIESTYPS